FLFDPERQDYLGLSLSLVRHPEVLAPRQPLQVATPLRILGMVVHSGDQDAAEVDEQRQRVGAELAGWEREGLVELGWVAGQTSGDLEEALDRGPWQILHVVDHGGADEIVDERTPALFRNAGRAPLIASNEVSRLLADHHTLRLVVLDACGPGSDGVGDGFAGAAGVLVRRGIPAVVAMQFELTDPAAARFAQTLYHSVAKCLPVDIGVLRGRRALRLAQKDSLEWGTPVLYLRAPGERIFSAAAPPPGPDREQASTPEPETLYEQALDAFWTEQWDQAIALLEKVLAHRPDHPDAAAKLEQARHEHDLVTRYTEARAAVDAGDWEQAVEGFALVAAADPANLDVRDRLEDARRHLASALLAQAREEASGPTAPASPRLASRPQAGQIVHARKEVNAVAFSPDGRWLATASSKNVAQIWDATSGQELLTVGSKGWRRNMEGVAFSPDGRRLATAGDDCTARIWDVTSGDELLTVTHEGPLWGLAFSPDGHRLATAGDDCTARIWDVTSGDELLTVTHDNWVRGVAFSPDGRWLATAGVDRTARVWDAAEGKEFARVAHDSVVWGVVFSPDGRWLATASQDCTARVWDAADGAELVEVTHHSVVSEVAFSPDGQWLATAGQDRTARIWDTTTGQEIATIIHADQVWAVAFSPDGHRLVTGSADKTARIWELYERQ
ncbi:MAG: CHAT domain-containing protein, partial [Pseudonocardiaceae bacterium]